MEFSCQDCVLYLILSLYQFLCNCCISFCSQRRRLTRLPRKTSVHVQYCETVGRFSIYREITCSGAVSNQEIRKEINLFKQYQSALNESLKASSLCVSVACLMPLCCINMFPMYICSCRILIYLGNTYRVYGLYSFTSVVQYGFFAAAFYSLLLKLLTELVVYVIII